MAKPTIDQPNWGVTLNDHLDSMASDIDARETPAGAQAKADAAQAAALAQVTSSAAQHAPALGLYFPEVEGAVGDGVTDDTAAIEAARAAAVAGGARASLVFKAGKSYAVSKIVVSSYLTYAGNHAKIIGPATVTTEQGIFEAQGQTDGTTVYDAVVRDFIIDANSGPSKRGVYLYRAERCKVLNNVILGLLDTVYDATGVRLNLDTVDCEVSGNHITLPTLDPLDTTKTAVGVFATSEQPDSYGGGNNATLTFGTATNLSRGHTITDNHIYGGSHSVILLATQDCRVADNYLEGPTHRGVNMSPISHNNTIANNTIRDFHSTGIHMAWGSSGNLITGNHLITTVSDQEGDGIKGYYGCNDNTVTDNLVDGAINTGVRFAVGSTRNKISGNRIRNSAVAIKLITALPVPYTAIATPPSMSAHIADNYADGCTTGVELNANTSGSITAVALHGNTFESATAMAISEADGRTVSGVSASHNTLGPSVVWTLARGERHFVLKRANTGLLDSPQGRLRSGQYYPALPTGSSTTTAQTDGTLRLGPWLVPQTVTFTEVSFEVTTAGAAGSVSRVAIYASDGNGVPTTLVHDAGTVATDTTGVKTLTLSSLVLTPGTYWIGVVPQGGMAAPTMRTITGASAPSALLVPVTWAGAAVGVGAGNAIGYTVTGVSGAAPSAPTLAFISNDVVRTFVKTA